MQKEFLKYDTIMFDFDGTLIDSAPNLVGALNDIIRPILPSSVPFEGAKRLAGIGSRNLIQYAFEYHKIDYTQSEIEELVPSFMQAYEKRLDTEKTFFNNADTTLKELKTLKKNLLLVTNKPRRFTLKILQNLNWLQYFDGIFCPEDVSAKKPSPQHILEALNHLKLPTQNALMVGDSIADYAAAIHAHIPVMIVGFYDQKHSEYPEAQYFINHY